MAALTPDPLPYIVVGLGNPGPKFAHQRHNIGFDVVTALARKHQIPLTKKEQQAITGVGTIGERQVVLAQPQTGMNDSGKSVARLRQAYCVASEHCLIVLDDLDLPLGKVRLRPHGSSGGHHGMESIITKTLTTQYPRLRIGIGRPANRDDVIDFVLTPFHPTERDAANAAIDLSVVTIECWLRDGFQAAMQALAGDNAKPVLAATDNEPAGSTHDKRH